jgi:hypothetical protein
MSMSQEEIEALMNGLDADDSSSEPEVQDEPVVEAKEEETIDDNEVDDSQEMSEDDIENLIAQTQLSQDAQESNQDVQEPTTNEIVEDDIDDLLAGIDGVTDEQEPTDSPAEDLDKEAIAKDWTDKKIDEGVLPLPVENNTKVVEQLSAVANDSEEKITKIFDVLSFIMDENVVVQKNAKELEEFVEKQISLLETLTTKFPNIELFKTNLDLAKSLQGKGNEISSKVDLENNELFAAMELMQFNDINRQKIERVMSVIRKLANYLNGIFEDDGTHAEVAVAKHIHGDDNSGLVGDDDMDALIAEFGN